MFLDIQPLILDELSWWKADLVLIWYGCWRSRHGVGLETVTQGVCWQKPSSLYSQKQLPSFFFFLDLTAGNSGSSYFLTCSSHLLSSSTPQSISEMKLAAAGWWGNWQKAEMRHIFSRFLCPGRRREEGGFWPHSDGGPWSARQQAGREVIIVTDNNSRGHSCKDKSQRKIPLQYAHDYQYRQVPCEIPRPQK